MLTFLDTEFTDFRRCNLIAIGLVTEDGQEFYAERTDFLLADCSDFVRSEVVPMLGKAVGAACTRTELTHKLQTWFGALPEPTTLICDYASDWELLANALAGDADQALPTQIQGKQVLGDTILSDITFLQAQAATYSADLPRHHALADARALRAGYLSYLAKMERTWGKSEP